MQKNCHHLKPFGLANFIGSAVLQGACGSRLQRRPLRLAAPANSTIAQFRFYYYTILLNFFSSRGSVFLNILAIHPDYALVKMTNLFFHSAPNSIRVNSKGTYEIRTSLKI